MKTVHTQQKQKGFTIIEVVLVLAIAGLIFLIVFLALPALQRSQRDTQRKHDISRFLSQLTAYQSNNQGDVPAAGVWNTTFKTSYLSVNGSSFNDPEGTAAGSYTIAQQAAIPAAAPAPGAGNIWVYVNARCSSAAASGLVAGNGNRDIAAIIMQEQGGFFCQNN